MRMPIAVSSTPFAAAPLCSTLVEEYDRRGNRIRSVDAEGYSFTNAYDGLDRLSVAAGPAQSRPAETNDGSPETGRQITRYSYDPGRRTESAVNALGETTLITADALGRTIRREVRDAGGTTVRVTTTTYHQNHHGSTVQEGSGSHALATTRYTDNENRSVLEVAVPDQGAPDYLWRSYDPAGNRLEEWELSRATDQLTVWATNSWTYDALNRVQTETVRDGARTRFDYDAAGNLTRRLLPSGLAWTATYRPDGQVLREAMVRDGRSSRVIEYDYYPPGHPQAGLLRSRSEPAGEVVQRYSYDLWGRLQSSIATGPLPEQNQERQIDYDRRNLVARVAEIPLRPQAGPATQVTRTYDGYGQILRERVCIGQELAPSTTQTWDSAGRRRQLALAKAAQAHRFDWRADGLLERIRYGELAFDFGYTDGGLLLDRGGIGGRRTVHSRDGRGRVLHTSVAFGDKVVLAETLAWRGDTRLAGYTAARTDFVDERRYIYAPWARHLAEEVISLSQASSVTNRFVLDHGLPGGGGLRTGAEQLSLGQSFWRAVPGAGSDAWDRVTQAQTTLRRRSATGLAFGAGEVRADLNGRPLHVQYHPDNPQGRWSAELPLDAGPQTLRVRAVHPSGRYQAEATSQFSVLAAADRVDSDYDDAGQIVRRTRRNAAGEIVQAQNLSWDAWHRLVKISARDALGHGYDWSAIYDGLDRRVRSVHAWVTNGVPVPSSWAVTLTESVFDPEVEFLEVGTTVNGRPLWRLHGPDLSGVYGGAQGLGGLEALVCEGEQPWIQRVVVDHFGNLLGVLADTTAGQRALVRLPVGGRWTGAGLRTASSQLTGRQGVLRGVRGFGLARRTVRSHRLGLARRPIL